MVVRKYRCKRVIRFHRKLHTATMGLPLLPYMHGGTPIYRLAVTEMPKAEKIIVPTEKSDLNAPQEDDQIAVPNSTRDSLSVVTNNAHDDLIVVPNSPKIDLCVVTNDDLDNQIVAENIITQMPNSENLIVPTEKSDLNALQEDDQIAVPNSTRDSLSVVTNNAHDDLIVVPNSPKIDLCVVTNDDLDNQIVAENNLTQMPYGENLIVPTEKSDFTALRENDQIVVLPSPKNDLCVVTNNFHDHRNLLLAPIPIADFQILPYGQYLSVTLAPAIPMMEVDPSLASNETNDDVESIGIFSNGDDLEDQKNEISRNVAAMNLQMSSRKYKCRRIIRYNKNLAYRMNLPNLPYMNQDIPQFVLPTIKKSADKNVDENIPINVQMLFQDSEMISPNREFTEGNFYQGEDETDHAKEMGMPIQDSLSPSQTGIPRLPFIRKQPAQETLIKEKAKLDPNTLENIGKPEAKTSTYKKTCPFCQNSPGSSNRRRYSV